MPGRIIELLRFKLDNRRNAIVISGFSAGREAHQEGGFHTHILMKFEKKINVNDANFMDVEDEDWSIIPIFRRYKILKLCEERVSRKYRAG
ncbi:hypothetical protein RhiirA5_358179 [Rhizophagus irregularis]|uniref:CRESS-DNA virus Rep endonuclease domain-containing protein n=1 Tax=Rhizophagus irregularis TaxID=588596 RepID=A0A2I1E7Z6_9GLOM|nr:hypothetical protein RhiirA5_358179 [Rhizophagus irregularis]PKC58594.1 hypothetical protein RhiirA1_427605 [Rhizophagus irregularis]PKY18226.1 hypothetical protein RhiirB3_405270 [Rhizophagus irregularis]